MEVKIGVEPDAEEMDRKSGIYCKIKKIVKFATCWLDYFNDYYTKNCKVSFRLFGLIADFYYRSAAERPIH